MYSVDASLGPNYEMQEYSFDVDDMLLTKSNTEDLTKTIKNIQNSFANDFEIRNDSSPG